MLMANRRCLAVVVAMVFVFDGATFAQNSPYRRSTLPQDHDYQKVLYKFMASVTEQDATHGVTAKVEAQPCSQDPEYLYRNYLYSLTHQPLVGTKRGYPAVNSAAACYTLPLIEQPSGVYYTPAWPETLMSFIQWDYPGNPYRDNRALKFRAFMSAASNMMMFHDFAEQNDGKVPPPIRPDLHGYNPVFWAMPYPGFKDILPPEVQRAYETGLKQIGERIMSWGIRREGAGRDYIAPVGLIYIARAINDPDFTKRVAEHSRPLFTEPQFFHPAGYWDDRGGIDTGFSGTTNWFAAWTGLLTDWPFVTDSLSRVYRLRGHLLLPEPDGTATGPSHFNSRLGSPVNVDQWQWDGVRDSAAAMITDEAAHFISTPTDELLQKAPAARAAAFAFHLQENGVEMGKYLTTEELQTAKKMPMPWVPRVWMSYNFPASVNPAYELYRRDAWAHRQALEKSNSPLLKSPFLRGEHFIRAFEQDFVVTRQPGFAAILHSGPIGTQHPDDKKTLFAGPLGLGGGQLSAFWTPQTGSVLLGLRMGMSNDKSFDLLDEWRTWPMHSVIGITSAGKVFTSARNVRPAVESELKANSATVNVNGPMMAMTVRKDPAPTDPAKVKDQMFDEPLAGRHDYARKFQIDDRGVSVETTVTGDGRETLTELYEVLPVYLRHAGTQSKATPTAIEFQIGNDASHWKPATEKYSEQVRAVKLTRFDGAVVVTFAQPQRAKLSPADWKDGWLNSGAMSRNVLLDLLDSGDKSAVLNGAKKIAYRIEPAAK